MKLGSGKPEVSEDRLEEVRRQLQRRVEHGASMMMSAALSLCTLLFIAVLVLPVFGPRVAALTAAAVVLGIVATCYVVCVTRVTKRGDATNRWPGAVWSQGGSMASQRGTLPEDPLGDRLLAALTILAAGAFALMLVWLVGR